MTVQPAERVETDLEVLEALEFEESRPCEAYEEECTAMAVWWQIAPCCSEHVPSCDDCRRRFMDNARLADALGWTARHNPCGSKVDATTIRFTPIKP